MAPTINREVARCSALGNIKEAGSLLHTLAVVYWSIGTIIALVILLLAPWIAEYWIQSKQLTSQSISNAIMLMALVLACRWPIGLYQGALMGAQHLTVSSVINIAMSTLSNIGAAAVIAFISPTIEAFFLWQAFASLSYLIIIRKATWKVIGKTTQMQFDLNKLKNVWKFTAGMSGVAISAVILMQLDKVLLSKILSLEDFGKYTLAGVVASGLYIILTPTFNVIYPRLSAFVATNDTEKLIEFYRSGTRLLLALLFPIAGVAAIFSKELLFLWTGNPSIASSVSPVLFLFIIGTAFNGAMHFPYALQLAYGFSRLPLMINTILVVIMIPTTIALAYKYGAVGGSAAWAILNSIYLFIGTTLTHKSILKGLGLKWLIEDVGIPLIFSIMFVGILGTEVQTWGYSAFIEIILGGGLAIITSLFIILLSPKLRVPMQIYLNKFKSL